jgi:arylsulfatase A-like enzyme
LKRFTLLVVAIALAVSCGGGERPLNLVIIAVDTLRPDHVGCYGYGRNTTPNIDRLAERGATFRRAVSQAPWTLASFATVFTSLYPTQHGAIAIGTRMRTSFPTLAGILKERGYATGAVVNAAAIKPANRTDRGFDLYHMTPPEGRIADGTTRDALRWIDETGDRPFFAFVHYFDPHLSYSPPSPYDTLFFPDYDGPLGNSFNLEGFSRVRPVMFEELKRLTRTDWKHIVALYDGEIAFTDRHVGSLVQGLEARGLAENTLIVFLSDHGEEFFEHGGFEHGHCLYDEVIRVPLIFSLPGQIPEGTILERQVRLLDVAPTVLDFLGLEAPAAFEGVSLRPLLTAGGRPEKGLTSILPLEAAYSEGIMHGPEQKSISAYPLKFIYAIGSDDRWLFDLEKDPGEHSNLSHSRPQSRDALEGLLLDAIFDVSDTWYVQMVSGHGSHTFDLSVEARRGLAAGNISLPRLMEPDGSYLPQDSGLLVRQGRSALDISDLELEGSLTLAFKMEGKRMLLEFDIEIDGEKATEKTYLGEGLTNPPSMPFTQKVARAHAKAGGRPSGLPDPPCVLIWLSEADYRGDTAFELDEETKKELRALGYIQ